MGEADTGRYGKMKAKEILVLWDWVYEFSINSYGAGTFIPQAVNESVPRLITMLRHLWEDKVVFAE